MLVVYENALNENKLSKCFQALNRWLVRNSPRGLPTGRKLGWEDIRDLLSWPGGSDSELWLGPWMLPRRLGSSFNWRPQSYRGASQIFPTVLLTQTSLKRNAYTLGVNGLFSSSAIFRSLQRKGDKIKTECTSLTALSMVLGYLVCSVCTSWFQWGKQNEEERKIQE